MAQTKRKPGRPKGSTNQQSKYKGHSKELPEKTNVGNRVKDEIWSIVLFGIGIFLIISLQTKAAGELGEIIANVLKGSFGLVAFVLPYYLIMEVCCSLKRQHILAAVPWRASLQYSLC